MNIIKESKEYGLLAEFVYLKLEKKEFKESFHDYKDAKAVRNYIKGLNKKGDQDFIKKNETDIITVDELEEMTDIKPHRQEAMLNVLDKYDIKEFSSDDGLLSSGFQSMLLQNKETVQMSIALPTRRLLNKIKENKFHWKKES